MEERNRAAADALEALLLLAEAEDGLNRLTTNLHAVDRLREDVQQLRKQGLAAPESEAKMERERLELVYQQEKTHTSARQLSQQLALLLAIDDLETRQIWPDVDLTVRPEPLEPEAEVATAMVTRADLALLEFLRCAVSPETLPALRQTLGDTAPGLGTGMAGVALGHLLGHGDTGESGHRRGQLETLSANRRRNIAREVRSHVAAIDDSVRCIALRKQVLDVQRRHVANLKQQQSVGGATPLDVRRAELEVVTLEQQLVHDVIQWKIALVKLREAQGLLAAQCGYYPPAGQGAYRGACR